MGLEFQNLQENIFLAATERHITCRRSYRRKIENYWKQVSKIFETLNVRLPLEITSVRHENLRKRVSDDSQRFIFRRRKKKSDENF